MHCGTPKSSYEDEVVYLDGFDAETFVPMNKVGQDNEYFFKK